VFLMLLFLVWHGTSEGPLRADEVELYPQLY
jgi:hypothetical protein